MIIAVDFDGTLVTDKWPGIGFPNLQLISLLKEWRKDGDKLILWTCRTGMQLDLAVSFCKVHGLEFDAVNNNLPENIEQYGGNGRKVYADLYIDDKAIHPNIYNPTLHVKKYS